MKALEVLNDIRKIRWILENTNQYDFPSTSTFSMSSFPQHCCGEATDLLAMFLKTKHGIESERIEARGLGNDPCLSHAWLIICNDIILDITADQFNGMEHKLDLRPIKIDPIIFSKNSLFHLQFHGYCSSPSGYTDPTTERVLAIINEKYESITK